MAPTRWLLSAAAALQCASFVLSHPLCLNFDAPKDLPPLDFCTGSNGNPDGTCCDKAADQGVAAEVKALKLSAACEALQAQVSCGKCEPWSAHLFEAKVNGNDMTLCRSFCDKYFAACAGDMKLPANYCDVHSPQPAVQAQLHIAVSHHCSVVSSAVNCARALCSAPHQPEFYCYPFAGDAGTVQVDPAQSLLKPYFKSYPTLPDKITDMKLMPDGSTWWLVSQPGTIVSIGADVNAGGTQTVLDLYDKVKFGGEQGVLGLAFLPNFATSKQFVINYIDFGGNTVIARYTWVPGDKYATAASGQIVLGFGQPQPNHNGGTMLFAPTQDTNADFYDLYITAGDGGGAKYHCVCTAAADDDDVQQRAVPCGS
eukprot:17855-Heterococcus_DN1.PRE.2